MVLLILTAIFLIVLVLIQRGKGGGLAGALGGMGGQSAFGTKAGDLFTEITIGVAAVWIVLCIVCVRSQWRAREPDWPGRQRPRQPRRPPGQQAKPGAAAPAGKTAAPRPAPAARAGQVMSAPGESSPCY